MRTKMLYDFAYAASLESFWEFLRTDLTILAQTVHHATEHRAQLLDALNARGYFPIVLDNAAVSSFEAVDRA